MRIVVREGSWGRLSLSEREGTSTSATNLDNERVAVVVDLEIVLYIMSSSFCILFCMH